MIAWIDSETTGLDSNPKATAFSVGIYIVDGDWKVAEKHWYINPGEEALTAGWDTDAEAIHQVSKDYIRKFGLAPEEVMSQIEAWVDSLKLPQLADWGGHNLAFDKVMIGRVLPDFQDLFSYRSVDTQSIAQVVNAVYMQEGLVPPYVKGDGRPSTALKAIMAGEGIERPGVHNALEDAIFACTMHKAMMARLKVAI